MADKKKYFVYIQNGLRYQDWGKLGGAPGPMTKKDAQEYRRALADAMGISTKLVMQKGNIRVEVDNQKLPRKKK